VFVAAVVVVDGTGVDVISSDVVHRSGGVRFSETEMQHLVTATASTSRGIFIRHGCPRQGAWPVCVSA
jgi:hypothetical protein